MMKSYCLFAIGVVLIFIAYMLNYKASQREEITQRVNNSASQLGLQLSDKYTYREAEKEDRAPAYLLAGLGGIALLASLATFPGRKKSNRKPADM